MTNGAQLATRLVTLLERSGVRRWCVCAGARNAELLLALETRDVHFGFDERSTAFFALGLAKRFREPVAVVTTSGTAAAELLPAIIEAHYAGLPLVAITADRPAAYRGTGAPQAIEQDRLYGDYVAPAVSVESPDDLPEELPRFSGPAHFNVRLEDPLRPGTVARVEPRIPAAHAAEALEKFFHKVRAPIALVGPLAPNERRGVIQLLRALQIPCLLETPSRIRGAPELRDLELVANDRWIAQRCDGILRLGAVPTTSLWRDVDLSDRPFLSLSRGPWSGSVRGNHLRLGSYAVTVPRSPWSEANIATAVAEAAQQRSRTEELFAEFPRAEQTLVRDLSRLVPVEAALYLGNSMPIREWDAFSVRTPWADVEANRGANGIDGQLSTFFGYAGGSAEAWALVGDLTALFDLQAPWFATAATKWRVVVVNNCGGGIFSALYADARARAAHALRFDGWARLWQFGYESWEAVPEGWKGTGRTPDRVMIELVPDAEQTTRFTAAERRLDERTPQ